jgi:hypothetical protein
LTKADYTLGIDVNLAVGVQGMTLAVTLRYSNRMPRQPHPY